MTFAPLLVFVGLQLSPSAAVPAPTAAAPAPARVASAIVVSPLPEERQGANITFFNVNTHETESFFLRFDGAIAPEDEARMEHLFRCKRSGHMTRPDRGLLQILAKLADRYQGHTFNLISAHRALPLSVRHSKHYTGQAIDIDIQGVDIREVRDYVWHEVIDMPIGLGHYVSEHFLHIDHRPGEPRIAWEQRHKNGHYHYNPRWATLTN